MREDWSGHILGRSVWRWLTAGRKRARRPAPIRPGLEQLERRELLSSNPFLVSDINPGSASSYPLFKVNVNGTLFFGANDGSTGYELWKSDGTSSGTTLVDDIYPGAGAGLSRSPYLTNVGGTLFFVANDGSHGKELWKSDGTSSGTLAVNDINPGSYGSYPRYLTNVSGTLFFSANDGSHGYELWKSDGSSAGTLMVSDSYPGSSGSYPAYLTNVSGTVFFIATDGASTEELWKSDGTSTGTVLVSDIYPGALRGNPRYLTNVSGTLFFSANDGSYGFELWKSDGTSAGTLMVSDVYPGSYGSYPRYLTNVSGTLFFTATDGASTGELWKSDGTSTGTVLVSDIYPGAREGYPSDLTNVSGRLFFNANDGSYGHELWTSDGTSAGTLMVSDSDPGNYGSYPYDLVNVNGTLFFSANDGTYGYELWALAPPTLASLGQNTAVEGSAAFTLTVTGTYFDGTTKVQWNGTNLATQFDSSTQVEALVPAGLVAEEGGATISVTGDNGTSNGLPFTITDAPLTITQINAPPHRAEGATNSFTLAVFTDGNTRAPASDFTATVTWGDGSSSTFAAGSGVVSLGGGSFALRGSHSYAEEGTYTLSVQILDEGGSSTSGSTTFTVADAQLTILGLTNIQATEGKGTGTIRVAAFRDGNTAAPVTDFTATITWGDGGTTTLSGASGGIVALGNGNFDLYAGYTYTEEGSYTLSVQVLDVGGASASAGRTVTVADARLRDLGLAHLFPTEGAGTGTFTVATFADNNSFASPSDFTATVTWGDGGTSTVSGSGVVSLGGGKFAVLASYTYAEEGAYTLAVQVSDIGGASIAGSTAVRVADARLGGLTLANPHATEGIGTGAFTVATFTDNNASAPVTDFSATVSWGDSSSSTLSGATGGIVSLGGGQFALLASHTYTLEGRYNLSVQVLDVGGASISGAIPVSVAGPELTAIRIASITATEGKGTGTIRVASFTDSYPGAVASQFTATITWGDGGTTTVSGVAGNIVAVGNGWFYLLAGHTYTEEGSYTLSVQVSDIGGPSIATTQTVTVADAGLRNLGLARLSATEGIGTGTFTVATFADNNPFATSADFTVTVVWGDGGTSTVPASAIVALGGGRFAVLAAYTYAEEGSFTLSVQVLDDGGSSLSGSLGIKVADAPLVNLSVTNPGARAGQDTGTFTVATFHDKNLVAPATDFTATVAWGDGNSSTVSASDVVSLGNGDFALLADHTWATPGTYTLSVQVSDVGGASVTGKIRISVSS